MELRPHHDKTPRERYADRPRRKNAAETRRVNKLLKATPKEQMIAVRPSTPQKMQNFKKVLRDILDSAVAIPGEYKIEASDPRFAEAGLTYREVIAMHLIHQAAQGNLAAIREVLDRELGKSVQPTENKNIDMTYYDFLMSLADEAKARGEERELIELEPEPELEPEVTEDEARRLQEELE